MPEVLLYGIIKVKFEMFLRPKSIYNNLMRQYFFLRNMYWSAYHRILGIYVYVTYLCNILCIWYHPCATKCIDANRLVFVPLELFHTEHGTEHNSHYLNKRILYFWITLYFVFLLFELIYFLAWINNWTIFLLVAVTIYLFPI